MRQTAQHISTDLADLALDNWHLMIQALHDMISRAGNQARALDLGDVTLHFSLGHVWLEHGPMTCSIEHQPLPQPPAKDIIEYDHRIGSVLPALVRVATDQAIQRVVINFPNRDQLRLWRHADSIAYAVGRHANIAAA